MTISYDLFINNTLAASKTQLSAILEAEGVEVRTADTDATASNVEDIAPLVAKPLNEPRLTFRIQFHHGPGATTVARAVREVNDEATTDTIIGDRFRTLVIAIGDALHNVGQLTLTTAS